ncbi:FKBP-type peptidyl-prolyl cis-trans isomerase [Demequina aurantiaca]|uniref:FKBP-type peptidyl-prolyl cis-trans isomerase n=1 Tax=Demequina aurantiaca TaxID=676200 RepID=UPI000786234C|nr:FKBP-type peptidyl-prolyl cis-trans isomerase [Demequina aurantiaca]
MKKYWLTATTLGAIAALSLTACSSSDDSTESSSTASPTTAATSDAAVSATGQMQVGTDADVEVLKTIKWTVTDDVPTLEFDSPLTVTGSASYVATEGDGDVVADGDNVDLQVVAISGADGTVLASTYETGVMDTVPMVDGSLPPELYSTIVGNKVGQTLVFAQVDTTATVEDGDVAPAVFYAVTVTDIAVPPEVADDAADLPTVTRDDDGVPSIDFSAAKLPEGMVAKVLVEGDGAEVGADQTVTANYTGWVWDGDKFDSSWDRGEPSSFPLTQVVQGWQLGLTGQKVGSKMLLVIPSELGYGEQGSGDSIPGGATLVFVVDIESAS